MLKRISAQEARQRLGELMDEVRLKGDKHIVERGNRPMVAVIPVEEYATWEKVRERLYKKVSQIRERTQDVDSEALGKEIKEAIEAARKG
jgi:prevent-host-death family protein